MVSAAPNLTRLTGTAAARAAHPSQAEWDLVTLAVEDAQPVDGYANLLGGRTGEEVDVAVRRALLGEVGPGWRVTLRARLTTGGVVGEGWPEEGNFVAEPYSDGADGATGSTQATYTRRP